MKQIGTYSYSRFTPAARRGNGAHVGRCGEVFEITEHDIGQRIPLGFTATREHVGKRVARDTSPDCRGRPCAPTWEWFMGSHYTPVGLP